MHIVFFEFVRHYGGAARSIVDLAAHLTNKVRVSFMDAYGTCQPFIEDLKSLDIPYYPLCPESGAPVIGGQGLGRLCSAARSLPYHLKVRRRAAEVFRRIGPSVICSNHAKPAMIADSIGAVRRVPKMIYMHGWSRPAEVPGYAKRLCRRFAGVFAVTHATKSALVCGGVDPHKIHVLSNSVDVADLEARGALPLAEALPGADRPARILVPADIIRSKGQHTAIEALPLIVAAGHDAVLWMAGEHAWPFGPNKSYYDEVQALARDLAVADRVFWLGRRPDLPQVIRAASVVVLPSHTEGQGRVIQEAMALGRPVAATPCGGPLDMILPHVTGLLFEVDDAKGLTACVAEFLDHPDEASRMTATAREFVRRNYDPERRAEEALRVFRLVAGAASGGSP